MENKNIEKRYFNIYVLSTDHYQSLSAHREFDRQDMPSGYQFEAFNPLNPDDAVHAAACLYDMEEDQIELVGHEFDNQGEVVGCVLVRGSVDRMFLIGTSHWFASEHENESYRRISIEEVKKLDSQEFIERWEVPPVTYRVNFRTRDQELGTWDLHSPLHLDRRVNGYRFEVTDRTVF